MSNINIERLAEVMKQANMGPIHRGPANLSDKIELEIGSNVTYYDRSMINPDTGVVMRALCRVEAITQDSFGEGVIFYHLRCYDETYNRLVDEEILPVPYMASVASVELGKFVPWVPREDDYDNLIGYPEYIRSIDKAGAEG